ncbi:MAG: hypothetical protein HOO06_03960 [Bdellovibrionaceae bacterium]|mgnify:CR=1 FL=1|nr:hypothetical protein [Pseudobdellovibrionaceae bacterium]
MKQFYLFIFILFSLSAFSKQQLGSLKVEEVLLKPRLRLSEPEQGGFEIGESYLGLTYELDPYLKAVVSLGSLGLINTPSYFYNELSTSHVNFGFFEAYAEVHGLYGRLRMGLIPLGYGLNGGFRESELRLPRIQLLTRRVVGLRDYGLEYKIGEGRFYSQFSIHNGETASNIDGRIWLTGKWAYEGSRLHMGLVGQTGETTTASTVASTETRAGFDASEDNKIRLGGFFIEDHAGNFKSYVEYHFGEIRDEQNHTGQFATGVLGFTHMWKKHIWFDLRVDAYDPSTDVDENLFIETALAISYLSPYMNSVVSLVLVKKEEQQLEIDNNEVMIAWKLSP